LVVVLLTTLSRSLGSVTVPLLLVLVGVHLLWRGDYVHDGDTFTSTDHATVQNRVGLRISGVVGAITVRSGR
jgi:hypothetical protein